MIKSCSSLLEFKSVTTILDLGIETINNDSNSTTNEGNKEEDNDVRKEEEHVDDSLLSFIDFLV
jgi:hypothetical protein